MIKNYFRILKKPHAYLQTILKAPVKFQKDQTKTVGGIKGTRYLLKIRNHAPRKAENSVPLLFFEKAGDNKINKKRDKLSLQKHFIPSWDYSIIHNTYLCSSSAGGSGMTTPGTSHSNYPIPYKFDGSLWLKATALHCLTCLKSWSQEEIIFLLFQWNCDTMIEQSIILSKIA